MTVGEMTELLARESKQKWFLLHKLEYLLVWPIREAMPSMRYSDSCRSSIYCGKFLYTECRCSKWQEHIFWKALLMARNEEHQTLVVAPYWAVSTTTSTEFKGARLNVCRMHSHERCIGDGRVFRYTDEAIAWAAQKGYLTEYYSRPSCFFGLRLSPATRKYLTQTGRFDLIPRLLRSADRHFFENTPESTATPLTHRRRF